jgi:hypothetical protein
MGVATLRVWLRGLHRKVAHGAVHSGCFQGAFSQSRSDRRQNISLITDFNPFQNEPGAGLSGERSESGGHQFVQGR